MAISNHIIVFITMSLYSKYLIGVGILGLIITPMFMFDSKDMSWSNNKELYWGMIALLAMVFTVFVENRARNIQNRIQNGKKNT